MADGEQGRREVAVVTGGASGFGRALGERCAVLGMDVVLLDIDGSRAEQEAEALARAHGVNTLGTALDVADPSAVDAAAALVQERFGRTDVVFSNVGVQLFGGLDRLTDDEWTWVLDINVIGAVRTTRSFLPLLRQAPRGRLAFTASAGVLSPTKRMPIYQTSKFAVLGLAESLRLDLADDGITVSVIFPAGMTTRHLQSSEEARPAALGASTVDPTDLEVMSASNPSLMRDVATPEIAAHDVVAAVLAGDPYIVTHGDVVAALDERHAALRQAAQASVRR